MPRPQPEARRLAAAATAGLACVAAVLLLSAAIRHGSDQLGGATLSILRIFHRTSASLEVLAMLAVGWTAWRLSAANRTLPAGAAAIAALTVFLSVLGILAGQNPPPAAAAGNLLGGLTLAAAFAWMAGRSGVWPAEGTAPRASLTTSLVAAQCVLGAWISIFSEELWSLALLAHAVLGSTLASAAAWFALRMDASRPRFALLGIALAAPAAGFGSALFGQPLGAVLAHAGAAALLVAAAAYIHGRFA
jgi:heme A synthase